ncbi:carboxymethylenebutenolidase [Mytilinidion resinicola]|uniref:Carboxymethylenebutenolidase n=1 Tax=Mytilinidion resinicola TaxID=574789 RepID=A0A6A6YF09_9PEZI|nr:carboxymethylenebutenolidase [Mytilinidion resinicola]KAF2806645.1 carboxymethylenebutenolidase [Mytilinidion resinicola]
MISGRTFIQPPLSRRGTGPGLILIVDQEELQTTTLPQNNKTLDPPPFKKWAEEGFAVAQVLIYGPPPEMLITNAIGWLKSESSYGLELGLGWGVISYGVDPMPLLQKLDQKTKNLIKAVVAYDTPISTPSPDFNPPILTHHGNSKSATTNSTNTKKHHTYPSALPNFVLPSHANHHPSSAALSHTRTLSFLKPLLHGPYFDLEAIWDEHTLYEFSERSVSKTMATMVDEPYVNHIPTMMGGVGRASLTAFYRDHFIFSNPDDTRLELVSRTVGVDRVIDEFMFVCTHDRAVDWLLPGVPSTGRLLNVPMTSVVNIRGDRVYHEHIAWDQATVLVQLGLLPDYLPFPYPIDGRLAKPGKRFEIKVPAAGHEVAKKLADESAVRSNGMIENGIREVFDT